MYRLLIVDDEMEIREGLLASPWGQLGIEVAGSCTHGLEALQFVEENLVHIVLADIRMPFMDGLELMNALKRLHPRILVVILSGYSEFHYAKHAIDHGAVGYLLKPTDFDAMFNTFGEVIRTMDERKQEESRKQLLERKESMLSLLMREEFTYRLLTQEMSSVEILQGMAENGIRLDGNVYRVGILSLDRMRQSKHPVSAKELKLIVFSLNNLLNDLWDTPGQRVHLVNRDTAECGLLSSGPSAVADMTELKQSLFRFRGLFKSTLSLAIGSIVPEVMLVRHSFESARVLLKRTSEDNAIRVATDVLKEENKVVSQAKEYIRQNYGRGLTLKEVAEQVYVTPGHLSMLFKESGETYLTYLTSLRMERAAEMLADIRYKVYEVAEKVGYSDQNYFTELFKKHTGTTPMDFREISIVKKARIGGS
ncbi:response regulator transcription factor [Cohnella silvisoli]|uniref:Response regulator n=1 Tax=Cohnella silvisoli TaxID=2873699 RepID=A0ABV1KWC0_9BACL|nr:response regulator [Cohnella silvisoli]MCD9023748.1 response regulator [Cohnella silvisoli]